MPWSFFFVQEEDGIRDVAVTGVQTCALPISPRRGEDRRPGRDPPRPTQALAGGVREIGRASCRERVEISVVAVSLKKKKMQIIYAMILVQVKTGVARVQREYGQW